LALRFVCFGLVLLERLFMLGIQIYIFII